jgi:chromosome segregation protein
MRLSKIKLAGFKSFVDPTSLKLPGNLTGIVGPNGCGKSNVIDAVRWVMGESSAKHLRGSSMEDVIFNGSSSRKPIGIASVELLFDNSDGSAPGPYAEYSEISVKRQVSRDGMSKYSLNGGRCRRRDIADLFLGTGLGPRSYAIIEQGMISRLIEAKPEDLRVFLEEAAGISKYKERRRETENRIRNTRENLDRLNDLREEIDKQLARLKRQSSAAERYKELKQEERQLRAEQLALRWKELKQQLDVRDQQIREAETEMQQAIAEQRAVESGIEQQRQQHDEGNDHLNVVQGQFYRLGAEISGIEQNIRHQQDLQQRHISDLEQTSNELRETMRALETDGASIHEIEHHLHMDLPKLEQVRAEEADINSQFSSAEQAMQDWQKSWDEINRQHSAATQQAQVERSRIEQLDRHSAQLHQRLSRIEQEQEALSDHDLHGEIDTMQKRQAEVEQEKAELEKNLSEVLQLIRESREKIIASEQAYANQRRGIHDCQGRLSSLEALQQSALGKTDKPVNQWLERRGLHGSERVAQQLDVEAGWETAVETVLGDTLEAVCVDRLDEYGHALAEIEQSNLSLVETGHADDMIAAGTDSLLHKISSALNMAPFLSAVRTAEDLDSAFELRASLQAGESIITRDGVWLGRNWVRIRRDKEARQGVLAREHELRELHARLAELEQQAEEQNGLLQSQREDLHEQERRRERFQSELNHKHAELTSIQSQINTRKSRLEHVDNRGRNLAEEIAEIGQQLDEQNRQVEQATQKRNESLQTLEHTGEQREQLAGRRESLMEQLQQHRQSLKQHREQAQELAIRLEGLKTRKQGLEENQVRMQHNRETWLQREQELQTLLQQAGEPIARLEHDLKQLLEQRLQSENALADARRHVDAITHELRSLEHKRTQFEQQAQEVRSRLEQMKLDSQELRVRSKTAVEQLNESGHELGPLLADIDDNASSADWNEQLEAIGRRISRLGPINLAAIDEYTEELKRKEYLDEQYKDVSSALETLENAIGKIDRETRSRFKDTYDHVNSRLKDKFPRLFGGGQAYLEMTGDDLLSTGVAVMAKPPGKRISNIHLLSGGEKALTAVALVFAIFELNPAPFCILDEVDAPLDEANVGRFCQLVKEMSVQVQFIYITHNKTTMEMSEQLCGVTMREAGVSRLVSVDLSEAATMAAA